MLQFENPVELFLKSKNNQKTLLLRLSRLMTPFSPIFRLISPNRSLYFSTEVTNEKVLVCEQISAEGVMEGIGVSIYSSRLHESPLFLWNLAFPQILPFPKKRAVWGLTFPPKNVTLSSPLIAHEKEAPGEKLSFQNRPTLHMHLSQYAKFKIYLFVCSLIGENCDIWQNLSTEWTRKSWNKVGHRSNHNVLCITFQYCSKVFHEAIKFPISRMFSFSPIWRKFSKNQLIHILGH